ncbi:hypothetical protein COR50_15370 [Chitinophaga caeni]|uniref:Uncharacterized protein n=1 Tax=Chitinophaga caeni TaxID=2029983 RepID=A0A291QWX0_9BACT|nr:hypothetical protein COR50_15370 [Chitinophaga caeni]
MFVSTMNLRFVGKRRFKGQVFGLGILQFPFDSHAVERCERHGLGSSRQPKVFPENEGSKTCIRTRSFLLRRNSFIHSYFHLDQFFTSYWIFSYFVGQANLNTY